MRFYMKPVVYEGDLQDAFVDVHDREVELYEIFMPEDDVIFISLTDTEIEDDAILAERTGDMHALDRNLVRHLLRQYVPVGTEDAMIVMD